MTAVSGGRLTASQFNRYVRDNLNETAPAKVTTRNQYIVPGGLNSLDTRRAVSSFNTNTLGIDPASAARWVAGDNLPWVAAYTGKAALVLLGSWCSNEGANVASGVSFVVSGATNIPIALTSTSDGWRSLLVDGLKGTTGTDNAIRLSVFTLVENLNPGTNVFTMVYRQHTTGKCWYENREIIVIPF